MLIPQPNRGEVFATILAGAELEFEDGDLQSGDGEEDEEGEDSGPNVGQYTREDLARLQFLQEQQQQLQREFQSPAQPHPAAQFQSPFAHNNSPPPCSAHSAGGDAHGWHEDPAMQHPRSAHEPFMTHVYTTRPPSQTHAPPPQVAPVYPLPDGAFNHRAGQQHLFAQQMLSNEGVEWLFVDDGPPPASADGRRPERQGTW